MFLTLAVVCLQRYDPVTTGIGSLLVTGYCVVVHQQSVGEALNIAACATVLGMVSSFGDLWQELVYRRAACQQQESCRSARRLAQLLDCCGRHAAQDAVLYDPTAWGMHGQPALRFSYQTAHSPAAHLRACCLSLPQVAQEVLFNGDEAKNEA